MNRVLGTPCAPEFEAAVVAISTENVSRLRYYLSFIDTPEKCNVHTYKAVEILLIIKKQNEGLIISLEKNWKEIKCKLRALQQYEQLMTLRTIEEAI